MANQLWKKLQTIHRVVGGLIQVGRNEVGQQTLISERVPNPRQVELDTAVEIGGHA